MKKIRKLFILLLAGLFLFSSCVKDAGDSTTSADGTELYINLTNKTVSEDNEEYFELSAENTMLIGNTVKVSLNTNGVIKVDYTSERAYDTNIHLSGSLTGGVKIQTNGEESVNTAVYLNNVTITSTDYPCLEITKGGAATVYLSGSNTFTDGRKYGTNYEDTEDKGAKSDNKGSLYCKGSLTIAESSSGGALTVIQAYKNCIATKDGLLTVKSGTLSLQNFISTTENKEQVGKCGLYGGTRIVVDGGSITFTGQGKVTKTDIRKAHGLKADDEDGVNTSNSITINGGNVTITTSNGKGIAAPVVNISGGSVNVTVTGEDLEYTGTWTDADGATQSGTIKNTPKGIEGTTSLSISGGNVFVRSSKTGIDTEGNLAISGGTVVVTAAKAPFKFGDTSKFEVTGNSATIFGLGSKKAKKEGIPDPCSIKCISKIFDDEESSKQPLGIAGVISIKEPLAYKAAVLISAKLNDDAEAENCFVQGHTLGSNGSVFISSDTSVLIAK